MLLEPFIMFFFRLVRHTTSAPRLAAMSRKSRLAIVMIIGVLILLSVLPLLTTAATTALLLPDVMIR